MNKAIVTFAAIAASLLVGGVASAQTNSSVPADNTRSNRTDASNTTATADAQKNGAADIDLTKHIRQSVMADKSLSTDAHNVKIVSVGGKVTLNGVVRSDEEKSAIQMKAEDVAGKSNVTNVLKVAPGK
jgi:hyperosmotically inducible periplasmic protein